MNEIGRMEAGISRNVQRNGDHQGPYKRIQREYSAEDLENAVSLCLSRGKDSVISLRQAAKDFECR